MKERILEFLKKENKSSAQFAEEINVQPSSISHILSGRNNPSLDFVIRMLEKYTFLSTEWLLFGRGQMYKNHILASLFDENQDIVTKDNKKDIAISIDKPSKAEKLTLNDENVTPVLKREQPSKVQKIVWFYENNRFEEYFPVKD